jgi:hypothetical protein
VLVYWIGWWSSVSCWYCHWNISQMRSKAVLIFFKKLFILYEQNFPIGTISRWRFFLDWPH